MMNSIDREFVISVKGLSVGKHNYSFRIEKPFFDEYDNSQIINASLTANVLLLREVSWIGLESEIEGEVVVECDRCLEDLSLPVKTKANLIVKYEKRDNGFESDEVLFLDPSESELNIKQFLYDYICLSLPLQRVHPKGKCNPEMIRILNKSLTADKPEELNTPLGSLKDLINN